MGPYARLPRRMTPSPLRDLVKWAGVGAEWLRPPPVGTTLLIYHRVGRSTGSEVDLHADVFADQVTELADQHHVVRLDDAVGQMEADEPVPAVPRVVVTFDDGTADFVDVALPILVDRGVPVTLYLATGYVDSPDIPPFGGTAISWQGLRDAVSTGMVTVGSHTHGHVLLDRCSPDEAASDLDESIATIEDRLGVYPDHFAYPKAVVGSEPVSDLVESRFRSAALAGSRPNVGGTADVHRLSRTPIQVSDGMRWFRRKAAGGMRLEGALRDGMSRLRYRSARN